MMSSLDTLFTRLSCLRFSLCSPMTWPPNCFFDSPAYIGSLMCASAVKKAQAAEGVEGACNAFGPPAHRCRQAGAYTILARPPDPMCPRLLRLLRDLLHLLRIHLVRP
ncbi:hypothetical protein FB451DRAFT_1368639 [Mycena latifolia]|nr:hypothetical protein FB451DRAFT_1368639 [Mycena latifolia]